MGTGAVIADLADFSFAMRGKDDTVLDRPEIQSRLQLPARCAVQPPGQWEGSGNSTTAPMSLWGKTGCCRVVVAAHPEASTKSRIGHTSKGVVYELFFTQLLQDAFTASDVVALSLHRSASTPVLADEDQEHFNH